MEVTEEKPLERVLKANANLFAWIAANMPKIHPTVICHKLVLFKEARLVA